jgi:hypothetical protein
LSYEDQQVIYFRYFIELSVDETAAALGVPRNSQIPPAPLESLACAIDLEYPLIKKDACYD